MMPSTKSSPRLIRHRLLTALTAGTFAAMVAAGCGVDESDSASGGQGQAQSPQQNACAAVGDYIGQCAQASACDEALLADCDAMLGIVNDEVVAAMASCVGGGQSPVGCLVGAAAEATPRESHLSFAAQFCSECALGVPGCEEAFFSDTSDIEVGLAVLPFGDDVVTQLRDECATGLGCAASFSSCAQEVLAQQTIPAATIECVLGGLLSPGSIDVGACGDVATVSSSATGGATTVASSSTGSGAGGSGGSGGAGGSGGSGAAGGTGGSGGGPTCTQLDDEPNDWPDQGMGSLGAIDDCNVNAVKGYGTFDGEDADWWSIYGQDTAGCVVDPAFSITTDVTMPTQLCAWFLCDDGDTNVSCPIGSDKFVLPGFGADRHGCCTTDTSVSPIFSCDNTTNETAEVWWEVKTSAPLCVNYETDAHF